MTLIHDCPNCGGHDDEGNDDSELTTTEMAMVAVRAYQRGTNPMNDLGLTTSNMVAAYRDIQVYRIMIDAGLEFFEWDEHEAEMMRRQKRVVDKVEAALDDFLSQNNSHVREQKEGEEE